MIFSNKKEKIPTNFSVQINGEPVSQVDSTKYLGVLLDHRLTFRQHTHYIAQKLIRGNNLISRLRHFVSSELLVTFYHSHFHSHLNYCSNSWGSAAKSYIQVLSELQDKALYLISFQKITSDNKDSLYKKI